MKTLFEILPEKIDAGNSTLIFEIGINGFSYAIKDNDKNEFVAVGAYEFKKDTKDFSAPVKNIIEEQSHLNNQFKKTYIVYSYKESVLIPFNLYSSLENENVLNLVHGNLSENNFIQTDLITEIGVYNAYRSPSNVADVLRTKFPGALNIHLYSVLLKQKESSEDLLSVFFFQNYFVVKLKKNNVTHLINSYTYNTPEEVSYILLNACRQFNVTNISVQLNGFIEKNSSLYNEIYKYFETVSFATWKHGCEYSEAIQQQPAHYFSHLFATDSCE